MKKTVKDTAGSIVTGMLYACASLCSQKLFQGFWEKGKVNWGSCGKKKRKIAHYEQSLSGLLWTHRFVSGSYVESIHVSM